MSLAGNALGISIDDTNSLTNEVENARFSLHTAVDARKLAERDAKLLMNRINLLKNEESKALKNIELTRMKARMLAQAKSEAAVRESDRTRHNNEGLDRASLGQDRNQFFREVSKASRDQVRRQMMESKAKLALDTRLDLQKRVEEKLEQERAERQRVQRRTEQIKQEKLEARRRIEAERIARLQSFRRDYEERLEREHHRKQASEELIAKLEKEEMELIERLRRAQDMQSKILQDVTRTCPTSPIPSFSSQSGIGRGKPNIHGPTVISTLGKWDVGGAALR
jgi:hypothetical protein